jgi:hypothetical protein
MGLSESGSMKGWALKTWVIKNKEKIKLILTAMVGIITYTITSYVPSGWRELLTGLVTLLGSLALDSFDFWVSEVKI